MSLMTIIKKELKELLTPATILPMLIMVIIFASIGTGLEDITDVTQKPVVGVIDEDQSMLSGIAGMVLNTSATIAYNGTDRTAVEEALNAVKAEGGVAVFVIPAGFSANISNDVPGTIDVYWLLEGTGIADGIETGIADSLLAQINSAISVTLLQQNNITNVTTVLSPTFKNETTFFKGNELVGHSPGEIVSVFSSQSLFIPIIIMMVIMTSGTTVITSMGLEKENKTLETLLTMPVPRLYIVLGKIIGAAVVGIILAGMYMVGFSIYMGSFDVSGGISAEDLGVALGPAEYALVGIMVFLAILAALAMSMVIGAFIKDYKSAQTMAAPIAFLVMIPMFVTIFFDFATLPAAAQALVFAIPFSHPMMAMNNLMAGEYLLVIGGIIYILLFSAAMMALAVWIFTTDRLLTGVVKQQTLDRIKKVFGRRQ